MSSTLHADCRLQTPVAFFIYRRPAATRRVFERIAQVRPDRLMVIADGPRDADQHEACAAARAVIKVDWDCDVQQLYSDRNLGLRQRVVSGLGWVFGQAEQAIILEDDCLPDSTFFRFCDELLSLYRDDSRVMHISGDNFLPRSYHIPASYYFSRYPHVWGWATWRRAWNLYDPDMKRWANALDKRAFLQLFETRRERRFWRTIWDRVSAGDIDTWDYQWAFACLQHDGLAIMPDRNLISNIGFGEGATHTLGGSPIIALPTEAMVFPLSHPSTVLANWDADRYSVARAILPPFLFQRVLRKLRRLRVIR